LTQAAETLHRSLAQACQLSTSLGSVQPAATCRLCPAPVRTYAVVEGEAGTVVHKPALVCPAHYNEKDVRRAVRGIAAREQRQQQLRPIKLNCWNGKGGGGKTTTISLVAYGMAIERKMKVLPVDLDDQNDLAAKLLRYSTTVWASQQIGARPMGEPNQTLEQVLASGGCYIRPVNGVDTPITHHTYMARPVTAEALWGPPRVQYPLVRQIPGHAAVVRSIQQSLEPFAVSGEGQAISIIPEKVPLQAIIQFLKTQEDGSSAISLQAIHTSDLGEIHVLYSGKHFDRIKSQVNGSEHASLGALEQRWQGVTQYTAT
jgi:AAA domain